MLRNWHFKYWESTFHFIKGKKITVDGSFKLSRTRRYKSASPLSMMSNWKAQQPQSLGSSPVLLNVESEGVKSGQAFEGIEFNLFLKFIHIWIYILCDQPNTQDHITLPLQSRNVRPPLMPDIMEWLAFSGFKKNRTGRKRGLNNTGAHTHTQKKVYLEVPISKEIFLWYYLIHSQFFILFFFLLHDN